MDITNKDVYSNRIMKAIVVNENTSDDPESKGRIQIYIPQLQANYSTDYIEYINDNNKSQSSQKSRYPWAYTTVSGLKPGNVVFVNSISNEFFSYVIIGIDVYDEANAGTGGDDWTGVINGTDILSLAMPIILQNEIGLSLDAYPNNIPDSYYGRINPNDNGAWSIGLIQWHASRAYNLLFEIAKNDSNWVNYWPSSEQEIIQDLKTSLRVGSSDTQRTKSSYQRPIELNGPRYNGTRNMLLSSAGKSTQLKQAENDTYNAIYQLQNNYSINNPAIIIYTADIMNQYGNGIPNTKSAAKKYSGENTDMMTQFEKFVDWCKIEYGYWDTRTGGATKQDKYWQRRKRTYSYIVELYKQGKLQSAPDLTSIGASISQSLRIPELGDYLWPLLSSDYITCTYGPRQGTWNYSFNYNTKYHHLGYHSDNRFHYGTDFASSKGVEGDPCIAVGDGVVEFAADGYNQGFGTCVSIKMDRNNSHYFCYCHLCKRIVQAGQRVKAGQVIGYMGNTGHSSGVHLHLGLHIGGLWTAKDSAHRIDPLPYLGKRIRS